MLLLFITPLFAQTHPFNNILQQTLHDEGERRDAQLPDPVNLTAEWWHYFSSATEEEELKNRIDQFLKALDERVDAEDPEVQRELNTQVAHIRANFTAYLRLKFMPNPTPDATLPAQEHYSLEQLMTILHRERDYKTQIKRVELDVKDQDAQLRTLVRQRDTALLSYLEADRFNPQRLNSSLELILMQTEVSLIEERLRLQRRALELQKNSLTETEKHKETAIKRLEFSPEEQESLKKRIADATNAIKEANSRLLREQAQILVTTEETAEDRAVARFRAQRALRAKINLASARVKFLIYLNEQDSLSLLSEEGEIDDIEIQNNISARNRELQELQVKINDWLNQNEVERTLSNQFLADADARLSEEQAFLVEMARDRLNLVQEISVLLQKLQTDVLDAYFLINIVEKQLLYYQGVFQNWLTKSKSAIKNSWNWVKKAATTALFKVGDTPVSALNFAQFLFILGASWWVAYWLNRFLYYQGNRRGDEKLPIYYIIGRLGYYGLIILGFFVALTTIGIDFTNFALVAGALAIGLGFGLQSIVNNFVSGLILLFERSIKVGDFIELQDRQNTRILWGEVKEINVRATIIRDNDNVDIIIPNSEFINTKMLNWTLKEPQRRMRYPFRVAYGTDKEIVRQAVLEAAEELPHTLKGIPGRNPAVWLTNFCEYYYEFELVVWLTARSVKRPNSVRAAYYWAIDTALKKHNIEIPVPQREHRFRDGSELPIEMLPPKSSQEDDPMMALQRDLFIEDGR